MSSGVLDGLGLGDLGGMMGGGGGGGGGSTTNTTSEPMSADAMFEQGVKARIEGDLGSFLGPLILVWSFDFIMFGIMLHQVVLWSSNARTERRLVQIIVTWVTLAASACTAYSLWYLWQTFIVGFGIFRSFVEMSKMTTYGIFDPITLIPVQIFYAERAFRITNNSVWVLVIAAPLMALGLTGAIGAKVAADRSTSLLAMEDTSMWIYMWIAGNLAVDLFLTGTIAWGLSRSKTGWASTDRLINRIIRTSVETALPGTMVFLAFLPVYDLTRGNMAVAFFVVIHPKVHVLSLFAVLNYRFTLRKALGADSSGEGSSSGGKRLNTFNLSNKHQQETLQLDNIKVNTTTYAETHQSPPHAIGLNRLRLEDEESAHSAHSTAFTTATGKEDERFDSSTKLHEMPVVGKET